MRLIVVTQEAQPRAFGPYRSWKTAFAQADYVCLEMGIPCLVLEIVKS